MKAVLLSASIVGSKTEVAMNTLAESVKKEIAPDDVTFINLKEYEMVFSDGRNYLDYPGDTGFITKHIMEADILWIGTPIFQASIPATLKNIFDLLPQGAFDGKTIGLVVTAGSPKHFLVVESQLKPILSYMKANIVPKFVFIEDQAFERKEIVDDDILFRLDQLTTDTLILAQSYQQIRKDKEEQFGF